MFDNSQLRQNKPGGQDRWSDAELLAGLEHFHELHGMYPSAHEIDAFPYLPSARSIQRAYGGLQSLRARLLPGEIQNHTKGEYRSKVAQRTYANGKNYEGQYYDYLCEHFQEIAVHEHKVLRPGDVSCDFFVYQSANTGFAIDIFYSDSIINLVNIVNIKLKRYQLVEPVTFLVVVGNNSITQQMIDAKVANRQNPLPAHVSICSELYFKSEVVPLLMARSELSRPKR